MKSIQILASLAILTAVFLAANAQAKPQKKPRNPLNPETASFEVMLAAYKSAGPATEQDLTGGFGGICVNDPVVRGVEREGTWLTGAVFNGRLKIALETTEIHHSSTEPTHSIQWFLDPENYLNAKNMEVFAKYTPDAAFEHRDWVARFDEVIKGNRYGFEHRFRKTADGVIAVGNAVEGFPFHLRGIQFVCHWFKKFE